MYWKYSIWKYSIWKYTMLQQRALLKKKKIRLISDYPWKQHCMTEECIQYAIYVFLGFLHINVKYDNWGSRRSLNLFINN